MNDETVGTVMEAEGPSAGARPGTVRWWLTLAAYGSWALAGVVLAIGFGLSQSWFFVALSLGAAGLGVLATVATRSTLRWTVWLGDGAFVGLVLLAAAGVWSVVAPVWALLSGACAVMGWDLTHFRRRLPERTPRLPERTPGLPEDTPEEATPDHQQRLEAAHLRRLLITVGAGVLVGLAGLLIQISYHFGTLLLLALVAIVGLSHAIAYLRRESD